MNYARSASTILNRDARIDGNNDPINPITPRRLSTEDVRRTIQDFARTTELAQQTGYDGVEIMGSEGYLVNQFIAEATNDRDDEYGGSFENRLRFPLEIIAAMPLTNVGKVAKKQLREGIDRKIASENPAEVSNS